MIMMMAERRRMVAGLLLFAIFAELVWSQVTHPNISVSGEYVIFENGSDIVLECNGVVYPLKWSGPILMENNSRVTILDKARFDSVRRYTSILTISPAFTEDTGRYYCSYQNYSIAINTTDGTYVYVTDPKELLLPLPKQFMPIYAVDEAAVIPCRPSHPNVNVSLFKFPDEPVPVEVKRKILKFDSEKGFLLRYPSKYFDGNFFCKAEYNGTKQKKEVHLSWKGDDSNLRPPKIIPEELENIIEGDSFSLECHMIVPIGITIGTMKWEYPESVKGRIKIKEGETIHGKNFDSYINDLTVEDSIPEDSGNYTCVIQTHSYFSYRSNVYVNVEVKSRPSFINTTLTGGTITQEKGHNQKFYCVAEGIPSPSVTWYKDHTHIVNDSHSSGIQLSDNNSSLVIVRVTEEHKGVYSCRAENSEGFVLANITLEVTDAPKSHMATLSSIIVLVSVIVVVLAVFLAKIILKERKQRRELEYLQKMLFEKGEPVNLDPDIPLTDQVELLPYDRRWEFPPDKLKLGKVIGQGAFGRVYMAQAYGLYDNENTPVTVAVKVLKERTDLSHQKALLQELKIMIHLGRHVNVLNLIGAVTKNILKGEIMVIVEYCSLGNLRHFLLDHREVFVNQVDPRSGRIMPSASFMWLMDEDMNNCTPCNTVNSYDQKLFPAPSTICDTSIDTEMTNLSQLEEVRCDVTRESTDGSITGSERRKTKKKRTLTTCDLLCYAFQVARGMEYLASKNLVHRDLAARNILLTEGNVAKICDFGLAKDLYNKSVYKKKKCGPLPIKWMALESIKDRLFSSQSDVWSFGIVLWELFTLGGNPYPGTEFDEEFFQKLLSGYRLSKPDFASNDIYAVMRDCWKPEPKDRPTFTELVDRIGSQLDEGIKKYYANLSVLYPLPATPIPDGYVSMKGEEKESQDQSSDSTVPIISTKKQEVRYINFPENPPIIVNDYLTMDSPVSKVAPAINPAPKNGFVNEANFYVNDLDRLLNDENLALKLQMTAEALQKQAEEGDCIALSSLPPSPDGEPHYRIPLGGKFVDPSRLRNHSDSSSGIVSDIGGQPYEGTFI